MLVLLFFFFYFFTLILLHSEQSKLTRFFAILSAIGLGLVNCQISPFDCPVRVAKGAKASNSAATSRKILYSV